MNENGRKRVLIITPSFGGGGAERVGVTLINSFDESKYDLFVITFGGRDDYFKDIKRRIDHACIRKGGSFDFFRLVLEVRKVMLKFRPNIVLSLLHYFNLVCGSASFLLKKDFTLILCEHIFHRNFTENSRFGSVKKYMMHFLYRRADEVVAISEQMRHALIEDFALEDRKVKVIYNPIPINDIRIMKQQDIKHRFFEDDRNIIIISVGRLNAQKRFDQLLRAFSLLREKQKDVHLLILGIGPLLAELQTLADQLGITKVVDFIGFQSNPYAWMGKADLFVLSSDYEGFPMVLLEAMACGLPIISTDCPSGPREIIDHERNGILVPVRDIDALANAMAYILTTKDKRSSMSIEAFNSVDKYGQKNIFFQYESLWNS